jgi:D-alanyl-D-alanine carboxypeptidase
MARRSIACLVVLLLAFPPLVYAKNPVVSDVNTFEHDHDKLKRRFEEVCQDRKFMGSVLITVDGRRVFSGACGTADVQSKLKNAIDTRFLIGSITKEFTAAAVLLLYQEKRFELSDPIGKYLPNLPDPWQAATIHQLLTHTSGVPIYTASADGKGINPDLDHLILNGDIPNQLLDLVRNRPLLHAHGEKFTYNNSGYILLGMLIEKISGMSYSEFVQKRIFNPLQMRDSGYRDPRTIVPRLAKGYELDGLELRNVEVDPRSAWSAGVLYSTVGDLTRWSEAMAHNKLLNSDSTSRMYALYPEAVSNDPYNQVGHYGYGIVLTERFRHQLQYHGGGIRGFNSVLQRYPEKNLVLAVLSNLDSDLMPSWTLADNLAQIWFESNER